jgi:hypothetical protein
MNLSWGSEAWTIMAQGQEQRCPAMAVAFACQAKSLLNNFHDDWE